MSNFWNAHPLFQTLVGAFVVGLIGSSGYLTALVLGFLGEVPIQQLRPKFEVIRGNPPRGRLSRYRIFIISHF
jgi:hypothetical protein